MKIVSGYLLALVIIIGALSLSMIWEFQSFQQSVSHISFSLPQGAPLDIQDQFNRMVGSATSQGNATSTKEFITPDKDLDFSYSSAWQETKAQTLPGDQKTVIFSAAKMELTHFSFLYLIVRALPAADKETVLGALKKEAADAGNQASFADSGEQNVKSGKISMVDATYQSTQTGQTPALQARIAIVPEADKNYLIIVFGPTNEQDAIKSEADALFGSIQITPPSDINQPASPSN